MKERVEGTLYLDLATRVVVDSSEFIDDYSGQLSLQVDNGYFRVGRIEYFVARVNDMLDKGVSPICELDGLDTDTADYCEFFLGDKYEWPKAVQRVWPEAVFGDVAILNRLIIYPPFRGKHLGLHAIEVTVVESLMF